MIKDSFQRRVMELIDPGCTPMIISGLYREHLNKISITQENWASEQTWSPYHRKLRRMQQNTRQCSATQATTVLDRKFLLEKKTRMCLLSKELHQKAPISQTSQRLWATTLFSRLRDRPFRVYPPPRTTMRSHLLKLAGIKNYRRKWRNRNSWLIFRTRGQSCPRWKTS